MTNPSEVLFDPSGMRLVVRHADDSLQVLDAATLRTIANIRALSAAKIRDIMFSAKGKWLLVKEEKNRHSGLRIFSLHPLQEVAIVDASVLANPTAGTQDILTRDSQGDWNSWLPTTAKVDKLLWKNIGSPYFSLTAIPETNQVLIRSERHGVSLLDIETHKETRIFSDPEKDHIIEEAVFNKANNRIAIVIRDHSENKDHHVLLKSIRGSQKLIKLQTKVRVDAIEFVDHGSALIMLGALLTTKPEDNQLLLWRWRTGGLIKLGQDNQIKLISVSPDGTQFATAEGRQVFKEVGKTEKLGITQVRIWDAQTGKVLHQLSQESYVDDLAYSPDGQFLAVKQSRKVLVYRIQDWKLIGEIDPKEGIGIMGKELSFDSGKVDFANNNDIVLKGVTNFIKIESLDGEKSFQLRDTEQISNSSSAGFKLSSNGRWLAEKMRGTVRVWEVATGVKIFEEKIASKALGDITFAGVSGDILVANIDGQLTQILWRADELISEACRRFSRDLTPKEWQKFFDQQPYKETCGIDGKL